ncbi:MAG: hypothetical protein QOF95_1415, partial [Pseudonocardiales bacterium]|nr:hypothetical protein [Pseudonocardiales bacterium]
IAWCDWLLDALDGAPEGFNFAE